MLIMRDELRVWDLQTEIKGKMKEILMDSKLIIVVEAVKWC